jgi:hypothetical protein
MRGAQLVDRLTAPALAAEPLAEQELGPGPVGEGLAAFEPRGRLGEEGEGFRCGPGSPANCAEKGRTS